MLYKIIHLWIDFFDIARSASKFFQFLQMIPENIDALCNLANVQ